MSDNGERPSVRVHIASSDVALGAAPAQGQRTPVTSYHPKVRPLFFTITLTADDPAQNVAPAADDRAYLVICAVDAAIVLASSRSDAAAGIGAIIPQNLPWLVSGNEPMFIAPLAALSGSSTSRVSGYAAYEE